MKNLMTLILLSLFCLTSYAQEKFTGIGRLKIGIDTTIVAILASENNLKETKIKTFMDSYNVRPGTFGKINYIEEAYISDATEVKDVSVYTLGEVKVADIPLMKVILKFYKNKLYSFHCEYSKELAEAMELKYPDFNKSTTSDTTSCINKATGNKFSLESAMFYSKWTNGTTNATTAIGSYYNDKCEKKYMSYVMYNDLLLVKEVAGLEVALRKEKQAKKLQETKSKLSEF